MGQGEAHWPQTATPAEPVWSIRTKLPIEGRKRDLVLFNLAIDSKLPGCDVVAEQADVPAVIPPEACYLGWQQSLSQLAKLVALDIPE